MVTLCLFGIYLGGFASNTLAKDLSTTLQLTSVISQSQQRHYRKLLQRAVIFNYILHDKYKDSTNRQGHCPLVMAAMLIWCCEIHACHISEISDQIKQNHALILLIYSPINIKNVIKTRKSLVAVTKLVLSNCAYVNGNLVVTLKEWCK